MQRRRVIIIVAAVLIVAAALLWLARRHQPAVHFDVDRAQYPVKGIDLSAHNGQNLDFEAIVADSVQFVILKATEGSDFCDAMFATNYRNADSAGLHIGAYHFFRFTGNGEAQGRHFLATVADRRLDLPLIIDVEETGNVADYDIDDVLDNLRAMVNLLRMHGRRVMIYTNKKFYRHHLAGRFDDVALWISSISGPPDADIPWTFWQHSHNGRVAGVHGPVDLNTVRSDTLEITYR